MSSNKDGYQSEFCIKIAQFSNKKLCEIVIVNRYLGSMKNEAIQCMQELAKRRVAGDTFDYETFIETEVKKLPEFKFNLKQKMDMVGFNSLFLKGSKK